MFDWVLNTPLGSDCLEFLRTVTPQTILEEKSNHPVSVNMSSVFFSSLIKPRMGKLILNHSIDLK